MADDEDLVLTEVDADGVATFTLNRPERRNAWTAPMENRYFDVLAAADADPAVRVGVLTGAGTSFCPGMDMSRLAEVAGRPVNISARRPQYAPRLFRKPLIAAINGACAGAGFVLAAYADLRWAAESARIATAFAALGLPAEYGLGWMLPRITGSARALELLWDPSPRRAADAAALGFVQRVVPDESLLDEVMSFACTLARHSSPESLRMMKRAVWVDASEDLDVAYRRSVEDMDAAVAGSDFRAGVAATRRKERPDFLEAVTR